MIKAELRDKEIVTNILSKAYNNNETINETIIQDAKREYRLKKLMEYSFLVSQRFGNVYLSDNKEAVALVIFPDAKRITFHSMLWDIKLLFFSTGLVRAIRAIAREKAIKKLHHKGIPIYHLWYFGTNPKFSGMGIGSNLMRDLIADSLSRNRTMYVEARIENNMLWYQKFGFVIYNVLVHQGRKWFCMKRKR